MRLWDKNSWTRLSLTFYLMSMVAAILPRFILRSAWRSPQVFTYLVDRAALASLALLACSFVCGCIGLLYQTSAERRQFPIRCAVATFVWIVYTWIVFPIYAQAKAVADLATGADERSSPAFQWSAGSGLRAH